MQYAQCCEQGNRYLEFNILGIGKEGWLLYPADGGNEGHEVAFCPFCGHDLSQPVLTLPEALELLLALGGPPLWICFDVDGTLADDTDLLPYPERKPYPWAPPLLRRLKDAGHTLLIQTARYMRQHQGCQQLAHISGYEELRGWLQKWNIPYDVIYFGKVSADIYCDDRGCRTESSRGTTDWTRNFVPTLAMALAKKRK